MLADLVTTVICVINCGPQRNCIMHMPVRILSESATANVCIQFKVCDADYKQVTVPMAASDTICDLCAADNNQCDLTCHHCKVHAASARHKILIRMKIYVYQTPTIANLGISTSWRMMAALACLTIASTTTEAVSTNVTVSLVCALVTKGMTIRLRVIICIQSLLH